MLYLEEVNCPKCHTPLPMPEIRCLFEPLHISHWVKTIEQECDSCIQSSRPASTVK